MYRCVSIKQMQDFDKATIEKVGSTTLMAKAAKAVYEEIPNKDKNIYIISGSGNNGGDGIALLELFQKNGYHPKLFLVSDKVSNDSQYFLDRVNKDDVYSINRCDYRADVFIDCILGTGFKGELKDNIKEIVARINDANAYVISVDIPSGLNGQSGQGIVAIKADKTIAIQYAKYGHFLNDGKDYIGDLVIKDIGIEALEDTAQVVEGKDIVFDKRKQNTNKGSFGRSIIIGGCKNYVGAVKIANMGVSALRVGAGLNAIAIPKSLTYAMLPNIIESTVICLDDEDGNLKFNKNQLNDILKSASAIAVGMGMGPNKAENKKIIKYIVENTTKPVLVDADGLNAFEDDGVFLLNHENVIITPHPKEFSRLFHIHMEDILDDPMTIVQKTIKFTKATILLKGASTIIAKENKAYLVVNGTPALAKGGSGDTLSGVILGLLAQGFEIEKAAYYGAYLCAKAATSCEYEYSQYGVLASDVAKEIKNMLNA